MSAAQTHTVPAWDQEEAPLCATRALAHAMAPTRGRMAPVSEDLADAALARVDLLESRWAVQPGVVRSTGLTGRASVLASVLARIEAERDAAPEIAKREAKLRRLLSPNERAAVVSKFHREPSPADLRRAEAVVTELRALNFDLWEVV